jgi:FemAB-related protein (PEP-CTERM system-associated)
MLAQWFSVGLAECGVKLRSTNLELQVERCHEPHAWDIYVHLAPTACNYHLWRWKQVIENTYRHPTYYLVARRADAIEGILPLVAIKSRLFGRFLVSLPFFNYGGVVADNGEARDALLAEASVLARSLGARHVELRQGLASDFGWPSVAAKVAMVVPLPHTVDELWDNLSSRLRNKIRSGRKHGFIVRWGGEELVDSFYAVFAVNMRNLGTPVYPRSWFENVFRHAQDNCRMLTLGDGEKPVAATLITTFKDTVELPWIASLPEERKYYSTILLYWTALEWAVQNRYRAVDLGRCTPGGGTYRFKSQWNCEARPLHWYYWLAPGAAIPNLRPDNPRFKLAIRLWQRLPLGLANWLGPRVVRSIP